MDNYSDILFPRHGSTHELSRIITGLKHEGEYRIQPVPVAVFDRWCQLHPQFPYAVQFSNQHLIISIMLPPHDRAAGIISNQITRTVDRMCPLNDALFVSGTGLTVLHNGVRKNGDAHLYSHQAGQGTMFPGVVVEVGFSDSRKSKRDVALWLNNSGCETKVGIACKVGMDQQKNVNLLTFDVIMFDHTACTRHNPLGRAKTVHSQDWSRYNGTNQTQPPTTIFDIPSWSIFSDGVYPPSYPPNPNPPPTPMPAVTNIGRQYQLNPQELLIANDNVRLVNNERAPIRIDFKSIADFIRGVRW